MSASKEKLLISYRPFALQDVEAAHGLSVAVVWPHRADDWRFNVDVGAGFVAVLNEVVIGTALYWKFGAEGASLGMVIVSPEYQGHGIGRKLMELILAETAERVTYLHATQAGKPLYEKLGFSSFGWTEQYQSAAFRAPAIALAAGELLRPLEAKDMPRVIELASRASGLDRSAVIPALLHIANGVVLERDGELLGFSIFRRFGRGHVIGPVVAVEPEGTQRAKALIAYWLAANEGEFVRIDIAAECGLGDWLAELGMARVDKVVKMVRNAQGLPAADTEVKQFAIVNQAMY